MKLTKIQYRILEIIDQLQKDKDNPHSPSHYEIGNIAGKTAADITYQIKILIKNNYLKRHGFIITNKKWHNENPTRNRGEKGKDEFRGKV